MGKWDDSNISFNTPDEKIDCYDCIYRKEGMLGYKNAYCKKYQNGKPNEILFGHKECKYYSK